MIRRRNVMTEQVLKSLFDFQRFARNQKLDALIRDTESRHVSSLSESELSYVNAAGVPEMMNLQDRGTDHKGDPWNQY